MNDDFVVVINSHGRPDCSSYRVLRDAGYTGRIVFTIDTEDNSYGEYVNKYGAENVFLFEKSNQTKDFDLGDNFDGPMGVVVFARNESYSVAEKCGAEIFCAMDDDLAAFSYRYVKDGQLKNSKVKNADKVFSAYAEFLKTTSIDCLGFSNGSQCMNGAEAFMEKYGTYRGIFNAYILSTKKRFPIDARICEDCAAVVEQSSRGKIFLVHPAVMAQFDIWHPGAKKGDGGMQDTYRGTISYIQRYYPIMRRPGCCKLRFANGCGFEVSISDRRCYPLILSESIKKGL